MTRYFRWLNSPFVLITLLIFFAGLDLIILGRSFDLSKSDWSGWVQAAGSIAALGIAIFVMSKQNKHAIRIVVNTDRRALLRRGEAVHELMFNAHQTVDIFSNGMLGWLVTGVTSDKIMEQLKGAAKALDEARGSLSAIPLHDLGSRDMVGGVISMMESMAFIITTIEAWRGNTPQQFHRGEGRDVALHYRQQAELAMNRYQAGMAALEAAEF